MIFTFHLLLLLLILFWCDCVSFAGTIHAQTG